MTQLAIAWLSLLLVMAPAMAQGPRSAGGAYDSGDYATCARLYGEQADRSPPVHAAPYAAAACLALAGDTEAAFERLQRTPSALLQENIDNDPDLASLHGDPRWTSLLERYRADMQGETANLDQALLADLQARMARDQEVRTQPVPREVALQVDRDNTAWLKAYLSAHGWPGYERVGRHGSQGFWLLAQHADQDPQFQEQALVLLGEAVARGQASGIHLAYLTDRVRVAQGRPQLYGTQFDQVEGRLRPFPIEDAANVDARRAAVGMETLGEYAARMEDL
jgi:hypothetical protein